SLYTLGFRKSKRNRLGLGRCDLALQHRHMLEKRTAFTTKKEYGRGEWEAQWATDQRTLTGLRAPNANDILKYKTDYRELYELAEQA
ncbi:hypothetical protein Tco_0814179, partial [Tanacetum coccineum]